MQELTQVIASLINLHQEGPYWDFKREWYDDKHVTDLLHDIICMSNNMENRDAYIIIGVDEENNYALRDVCGDPHRRNTEKMVTFLRDKKFAGDIRPITRVETLLLGGCNIDVIIIQNSTNTPYYLRERFLGVFAYNIYTRVQDTNTPINASADIHHVEYLWKKRFGLIVAPLERIQIYLQHREDWVDAPSDGTVVRQYYRMAPEFVIEHTLEPIDGRDGYEFYLFAQTDTTPHWSDIRLYYHQTLMAEVGGVSLDGGRYFTSTPLTTGITLSSNFHWDILYKYMVKGSLEHIIHRFYFEASNPEEVWSCTDFKKCILIFENEEEHSDFRNYVRENWNSNLEDWDDDHLPSFPKIKGYNVDEFKRQYIHAMILNEMLTKFRKKKYLAEWGINK